MIQVDIPHKDMIDDDESAWIHLQSFATTKEAVAFIRKHIDPYCTDDGYVRLICGCDDNIRRACFGDPGLWTKTTRQQKPNIKKKSAQRKPTQKKSVTATGAAKSEKKRTTLRSSSVKRKRR